MYPSGTRVLTQGEIVEPTSSKDNPKAKKQKKHIKDSLTGNGPTYMDQEETSKVDVYDSRDSEDKKLSSKLLKIKKAKSAPTI